MEIKNIKAIHNKELILDMIDEGEHEGQDFKFSISDSRKIARSISAFANNNGGRLLIGVKDNGNIAGIRNEEEFYMVEQAGELYCKPSQSVSMKLYCVEGKYVLLATIAKSEEPVLAQDDNRRWQPYFRIKDENIQVPDIVLRSWKRRKKRTTIEFSEAEQRLLRYVADTELATVVEIATHIHLSTATTEEMVLSLVSIGALEFVYDGSEWKIAVGLD